MRMEGITCRLKPKQNLVAIIGILLNTILPGKDYEFGKDPRADSSADLKV